MAKKRDFEIAFVGLKLGVHEYNYEVDDCFFEDKVNIDFTNCKANIKLLLDKKVNFMLLKFEIGGKADSFCDRCGNPILVSLWDEFNMVIKQEEDPEKMNDTEEDPDVFYISRSASHIDVANWIYEFVLLSFPLQKICSDDEKGSSNCNQDVIKKLLVLQQQHENSANNIWKGLQQFKEK